MEKVERVGGDLKCRKYGRDNPTPPSSSRRGAIANVFRCKFPQSASGT